MGMTKIITYKTENYSKFKKILGNRELSESNIKNIIKNIKENGLKPTIVIVNEKFEIIDGQHRIEAFKRLHLPVYYQVYEGLTLADCLAMNTNGKVWTCNDYVDSYAQMGKQDYIDLKWYSRMYPEFTLNSLATVLCNKSHGRTGDNIRKGMLQLIYKGKEAEERLEYICNIYKQLKNFTGRRECFLLVLSRVMNLPSIDRKRLLEQMTKYGYLMTDVVDNKSCLAKFEEIYNYKKATKIRFISQYYEIYEDKTKEDRKEI